MTTLREAAQRALEALEKATRYMSDSDYKKLNEAIETLRAALAEPNHDYERGFVGGMSEQVRRDVERDVMASLERFYAIAVTTEREACAKVCERLPAQQDIDVRDECAAAIRARGQ